MANRDKTIINNRKVPCYLMRYCGIFLSGFKYRVKKCGRLLINFQALASSRLALKRFLKDALLIPPERIFTSTEGI